MAKNFGLLRLPKMPEMKSVDCGSWRDAEISWDAFKYADQAQEAKRVAAAIKAKEGAKSEKERRQLENSRKKKRNAAWSEKLGKKQERESRRGKRISKKKWLKAQEAVPGIGSETLLGKRQRDDSNEDFDGANDNDDWAELAREEKMAKRLRNGGVSQKDFDAEFGDL
jgi:ATP-dependent RNA helicase DDX55/SPB4